MISSFATILFAVLLENSGIRSMDKQIDIFIPIINNTQEQLFFELLCCIFGTFHFILQTATISIYQSWNRKIDIVLLIVALYRDSILRSSDPWPQTRMLNVLCMSKDDNMYVSAQKLRIKAFFRPSSLSGRHMDNLKLCTFSL